MPPPIANMLAIDVIRRSGRATLLTTFNQAPPRLFNSLARRMRYLHALPEAVSLAERLLAAEGPLGEPATLKGTCCAPVRQRSTGRGCFWTPRFSRLKYPVAALLDTPNILPRSRSPPSEKPSADDRPLLINDRCQLNEIIDETVDCIRDEGGWKGVCVQQRRITNTFA